MKNGKGKMKNKEVRRCSGGWWEVYDPMEDVYHMYSSQSKAIAAQKKIEQKIKTH